jgi:hypothetical protein
MCIYLWIKFKIPTEEIGSYEGSSISLVQNEEEEKLVQTRK